MTLPRRAGRGDDTAGRDTESGRGDAAGRGARRRRGRDADRPSRDAFSRAPRARREASTQAQNHDDGGALLKDDGAKSVVAAIGAHDGSYAVQWKACACVQAMAARPALSAELGKAGVVGRPAREFRRNFAGSGPRPPR